MVLYAIVDAKKIKTIGTVVCLMHGIYGICVDMGRTLQSAEKILYIGYTHVLNIDDLI